MSPMVTPHKRQRADECPLIHTIMAQTLADQLGLDEIGPGQYVSKYPPARMGTVLPIAYGGCTLGLATHAAYRTVPSTHSLYSLVGHFLGPASTTEKLYFRVHVSRNTRTFVTRRVQATQVQSDGKVRVCLELLADFQVEESSVLTYSSPPATEYSGPEQSRSIKQMAEAAVSGGLMDAKAAAQIVGSFNLDEVFLESRFCPEGVSGQNVLGANKLVQTTQDHLPFTEKASADWIRTRMPLGTRSERMSAVSFVLDAALSFVPVMHSQWWLDDLAACSTLDFALRIFVPDIHVDAWHLRERKATAGGFGRTYAEGRLWDDKGILVASMTQQSIMRPKADVRLNGKL
jgi:acyl-CoA thioesterase II